MTTRVELERLGEEIAEHAAHIDAAMHTLLTKLRDFDARGGWYAQGARTCAHWCAWRIGWGLGMAREHLHVAKALAALPKTDEQMRTGKLSYSKARAITRVACPETEGLLLHVAAYAPASALERLCQKHAMVKRLQNKRPYDVDLVRAVERRSLEDGMMKIAAVLRPDEAAVVWKAIEQARKNVPADSAETTDSH